MKRLEEIFPKTDDAKIAETALRILSDERSRRKSELVEELKSRVRILGLKVRHIPDLDYARVLGKLWFNDYIIYDWDRANPMTRMTESGRDFFTMNYEV